MLTRLTTRWGHIVYRFPWLVISAALATAFLGVFFAKQIEIRSNFKHLLPDNSQSVKDLDAISKRVGGMGTLIVHMECPELEPMKRFADILAEELGSYPKEEVLFVDYTIDSQKEFFERNKYLYLSIDELTNLRSEIQKHVDEETAKANPFYVDLSADDAKEDENKKFSLKAKRQEYDRYLHKFDKYIDGYLTNEDGTALIVVVKTPGNATGVTFAEYIVDKVEKHIAKLNPKQYHKELSVNLTGELMTVPEETRALRNDILVVSNLCVLLVLVAVSLYYRSLRMTIILGLGLLGGVATTFGIVYLHIGYLTAATAFLAAIVAGNGINFGIYFLARYLEERQTSSDVEDALATAMRGTVVSVSTAAIAAGTSYASLMGTQFKGFNQFGFIGGVGMLTCLVFALTLNPALIVLMERHFPFKQVSEKKYWRGRIFSSSAAWMVERYPKAILGVGVIAILASIITLVFFLRDPFEYNFRKLRNQYSEDFGSGIRSGKAEKILGERSSPHVVLADNFEQVPKIKTALGKFMKTNPDPDRQAIKFIKTIYDYLPGTEEEQREKITIINEIRNLIKKNVFKTLSEKDRQEITDLTPPSNLSVVTVESLPEKLVRPYVELDGTRGTLMYVDMNGSIWKGESLERFSRAVSVIKLDDGKIIRSSGKIVIFNDMIQYVTKEGPYATVAAFLLVLLVIAIAFRKKTHIVVVALSMTAGVVLMMGVAVALGQKINFLNFIAIPIQFGIGVDYSVNIYSRFIEEGPGSIGRVLRSTGGAVMITSATTIIGYGSMWFSINGAINSFGTLANIGEITCLLVAVLMMPAYLALFRKGFDRHGSNI